MLLTARPRHVTKKEGTLRAYLVSLIFLIQFFFCCSHLPAACKALQVSHLLERFILKQLCRCSITITSTSPSHSSTNSSPKWATRERPNLSLSPAKQIVPGGNWSPQKMRCQAPVTIATVVMETGTTICFLRPAQLRTLNRRTVEYQNRH